MITRRTLGPAFAVSLVLCAIPGWADACPSDIAKFLAGKAVGVVCTASTDLTTKNPATTPANNTTVTTFANRNPLPGLANGFGAFTPTTDRSVISNGPAPINGPVPGVQVEGWFADDPLGHEARFLLRFPDNWNGRLVVAGASGTRSEFNGDWAWSDYVLQKGYAYASQNKGVYNLYLPTNGSQDPLACRLNPSSTTFVHFFDNDAGKPFTQWTDYMLEGAQLAQGAAKAYYHHPVRYTYAVGTSNGGYQVRRAIEQAPNLFDGGVDWEGTFIDPNGPNILISLPPAIANFLAYAGNFGPASFDPTSQAAQNILNAGYPPDIVLRDGAGNVTGSLWLNYWTAFWEVTACQWQKRFDPSYRTYVGGLGNYDYFYRAENVPGVYSSVKAVETTGKIKKPLITVAGTMDALLPIQNQARAYEALVKAWRKGNDDKRKEQYRLYEVQNGNHIEAYKIAGIESPLLPPGQLSGPFPELEVIQPYAQNAFDLLVDHVENDAPLPKSQCIPKGGSIESSPSQPGHCSQLFVP